MTVITAGQHRHEERPDRAPARRRRWSSTRTSTRSSRARASSARSPASGDIPLGYYNDPKKTAEVFIQVRGTRYVMPGDFATVEADGSITLLGRGSIVINSGGEKIFPEEVESAVRSHPDVMDAIVCGAPDERWGQTVAAIVQPRVGHERTVARGDPGALPGVHRRLQAAPPPPRRRHGGALADGQARLHLGRRHRERRDRRAPAPPEVALPSSTTAGRCRQPCPGGLRCADHTGHAHFTSDAGAGRRPALAPRRGTVTVALAATSLLARRHGCRGATARRRSAAARQRPRPHVDPTTSWTVYHGNPLGTGVDTSGVTFSPPTPPGRRRCSTARSTGSRSERPGGSTSPPRTTPSTRWPPTPAPCCGPPTSGPRSRPPTPLRRHQPDGRHHRHAGARRRPRRDLRGGRRARCRSTPAHVLVGLNMYTGTTLLARSGGSARLGEPAGDLLQRTGLNLSNGNVVFGYGGNDGGLLEPYHGWVVAVPEGGGTVVRYDTTGTTPNGNQGAVWMGGAAPEVDGAGNIWAATGNGSSSSPYDGGDSVIELSPGLGLDAATSPRATGPLRTSTTRISARPHRPCSRTAPCCRSARGTRATC